ncbi:MAG: hypothetical protein A2X08_06745 [Bacteroidetes bacterium GWA2_32_17]|nr:MAG: hypothetical protein A2X08_06745 [Bacteroidetes bacterium GWA2_32_17]
MNTTKNSTLNNLKAFSIVLFLTLLNTSVFSQKEEYQEPQLPIDQESKLITYTKVVDVTANKDSLYNKGQIWFHKFYKNPTGVIREQDAASGKILGKHQIKILNAADKNGVQTMKGIVQYTITTQFKDNKARIVISEINLKSTSYTPIENWLDKTAKDFSPKNYFYLDHINKQLLDVIANFESFIKEQTKVKKDEW